MAARRDVSRAAVRGVVLNVEPELERRLVARLKAGDASAFEAVYEAYRPRLFTFLVRLTRRRDVAEDLLHETWLRLVSHAARLADDTSLAAWLFTVARNLFASWCRHREVDAARVSEPPAAWPMPPAGESPFQAAARGETERLMERALARLPVGDREVLLMVAVGGLTPSDAARAIGVEPEALRKRLQRARERLAAEMESGGAFTRAKAG
jgi:RNA polymerase sigma factor (sigma-70 family)